jgi:ankyrin repeat protein/lipoprotein-anchoring transpeptidase ErfK/SrfK
VTRVGKLKVSRRWLVLVTVAGFTTACDGPRRQALRELAAAGVEPSGHALVAAALAQDARTVSLLLDAGVHTEQRDPRGRTPLRIAVDNRDLPSTARLIAAKAGVNTPAADQASPLGAAVAQGESGMVGLLLANGAQPDGRMPDGEKVLPWAIREGRLAFVRMMMQAGADPHLRDCHGNPLLHVAMESGRREIALALIDLGADPGAVNAAGETTVQLALRRGWSDVIPPLVAAGGDPNAPGPGGLTPLDQALAAGDGSLVAQLLQAGADPNAPDAAGLTPLARALLAVLLQHRADPSGEHGSGPAPFHRALQSRWAEGMRLLAQAGADVNQPGADGRTPLELAVAADDLGMLGELLRLGAWPAVHDRGGRLLVERAAAAGRGAVVKLLLDYGSPAGAALYQACRRRDPAMAELLLACGAAPTAGPGPLLDTPLAAAIRAGADDLAAVLASQGWGTNCRLPEGQTALHLAIAKGCHRTVKCLLEAGADPNLPVVHPVSPEFIQHVRPGLMRWSLTMDRNVTPLMLAADAGVPQTAIHLLQAGGRKNVWTRVNHYWPINFAARRDDVKMMRAMLGQDPEREDRRLVISLSEQRLRMYDATGTEVFTSKVSTGRKGYATRTGDFVITDKNRTWTSTIYHASMPYFQRLSCSDFGLHQGSVPGYPASHGCIRVPAGKASQLFAMTQVGDRVQIVP